MTPSLEDIENEIMWVILHVSAVTEKFQLVVAMDRTREHRLERATGWALSHSHYKRYILPLSMSFTKLLFVNLSLLIHFHIEHYVRPVSRAHRNKISNFLLFFFSKLALFNFLTLFFLHPT